MASASTTLAIPGTTPLTAVAVVRGRDRLDPRFVAVLDQAGVEELYWDKLGDRRVTTSALFGSLSSDENVMHNFFKTTLNVDLDTDPLAIIARGTLTMAWEACRMRHQIETRDRIEREVAQLPPQISHGDFDTARRAYETSIGYELQEHLTPSQPLFEMLLAQVETNFEPVKLTSVTSLAQQKVLCPTTGSSGITWDERAKTFKKETKVFEVAAPVDSESLETRIKVLANAYCMIKMRFLANAKLATIEWGTSTGTSRGSKVLRFGDLSSRTGTARPSRARTSASSPATTRRCGRGRPG
jgi:hypothetical protein